MQRRAARDADLVARAKEGNVDAFERLVVRHRARLLSVARHTVGDREAAQDIVQEALVRAFRFLRSLREGDRFGPWLNTIVRRLCQQWLRDGLRRPEPVDGGMLRGAPVVLWGPQPESPGEVVERVRAALAVLSQRERRVMILHYLEGRSCEEIARSLGISNAGVRRILHYSRRKARQEAEVAKQAEVVKRGPRKLVVWMTGDMSGTEGRRTLYDHTGLALAQTICLAVNKTAKTIPQIAEQVEAHESYVQQTVDGMVGMALLATPKPNHYLTTFIALDAEDGRRLISLAREPAAAAAQRLAAAEPRLREAYEKTPLATSGWGWQDVIWPTYALIIGNVGVTRNLPPAYRPVWPQRPDGGRYWLTAFEEMPELSRMWLDGMNADTSAGGLSYAWFWSPGLRRQHPWYFGRGDRGRVVDALAGGPRTEAELLTRLEDDPERWRGALAELVEPGLVVSANGAYRLNFPVLRKGDSDVLTPVVDAIVKPIVDEIVAPASADLDARFDEMRYQHLRDQYPHWHGQLASDMMGEAIHFLLEQGVLPRPPDPAPPSFCVMAWEEDLPLMRWGFGN